jgi:predicted RND superfamily exporter protein
MLPADAYNVELYQRFGAQFGGANTTLFEIRTTEESIYTTAFLEKYKRIADDIYYHPDTIRHLVQSLALRKAKAITGAGGRVEIEAIMWPDVPKTEAELAEFRRAVNAQYRGFLVSDDEKSAMVMAEFTDEADFGEVIAFVDTLRARDEDATTAINVVGRPVLLGYIYAALDRVFTILAVSLVLIAVILFSYFRTWIGVAVPMLAATVATIWGLGAMGAIRYNLDPLLLLLPAFIFAIVLSHGVQLTSRVLENLESGMNMREAARAGLARLLIPGTAAILTDAAGFGVLALVTIPSIQALALICGVWLLSIAPALILAAAILCMLPTPRSHRRHSKLLHDLWTGIISLEKHKYLIVSITACFLAFGVYYAQNLKIGDAKGSAILWPDSRYNVDVESINSRYSGLGIDMMQVYIEGDENTMLDPKVYHQIEALDRFIYEEVAEARPAQSLVPIIKLVNSVLYEGDPSYELIPDTTQEIGFDIYMFRSRGEPGDFSAYTDQEWRIGNVSIFMEDHSVPTIARLTASVKGFFDLENRPKSSAAFLYSGGQIGIVEALNEAIAKSNVKTMLAIALVIALCIIVYYRSLIAGFILLFSLATANSLTYAFMAYKDVGLNVSTLPLAALGVGLGVDYGIYMLDRIREEFRKTQDVVEAITRAFLTAGNAIFITAITMVSPLLPWVLLSPLRFQAEMGMLLGLVLLMNMLGALLFVPAACVMFKPRSIFAPAISKGPSVPGAGVEQISNTSGADGTVDDENGLLPAETGIIANDPISRAS